MFEKIKELLAEQLFLEPEKISLDSKLVEDLGADSLDVVQLLIAMETEFGATFTDEDIKGIVTVKDIVDLMEK